MKINNDNAKIAYLDFFQNFIMKYDYIFQHLILLI